MTAVAYCTPAQVKAVLARNVAVPGGTAADLDDTIIQGRIDAAQAEVDMVLARRYTVPFTGTVPPAVVQITIAIAAYLATLTERQSFGMEMTDRDPAMRLYEWATGSLGALAAGSSDLPEVKAPDGTETSVEARSVSVHNPYSGALFTAESWGLGSGREWW